MKFSEAGTSYDELELVKDLSSLALYDELLTKKIHAIIEVQPL